MRYSSGVKRDPVLRRCYLRPATAAAWLALAAPAVWAQAVERPGALQPPGSAGFCLFEIPGKDGATRLVNIVIIQFVDVMRDRVRLTYGGGNFGSGYEADIAVKSREEGMELVRRLQQTARECGRHAAAAPPPAVPNAGVRIAPPITGGADPSPTSR